MEDKEPAINPFSNEDDFAGGSPSGPIVHKTGFDLPEEGEDFELPH